MDRWIQIIPQLHCWTTHSIDFQSVELLLVHYAKCWPSVLLLLTSQGNVLEILPTTKKLCWQSNFLTPITTTTILQSYILFHITLHYATCRPNVRLLKGCTNCWFVKMWSKFYELKMNVWLMQRVVLSTQLLIPISCYLKKKGWLNLLFPSLCYLFAHGANIVPMIEQYQRELLSQYNYTMLVNNCWNKYWNIQEKSTKYIKI